MSHLEEALIFELRQLVIIQAQLRQLKKIAEIAAHGNSDTTWARLIAILVENFLNQRGPAWRPSRKTEVGPPPVPTPELGFRGGLNIFDELVDFAWDRTDFANNNAGCEICQHAGLN